MDVATIEMPKTEARKAFLEYKDALSKRHDDETAEIMRGYRELSKGKQLLHLSQTIEAGGFEHRHHRRWAGATPEVVTLPKLAICRADERWVTVTVRSDRSVMFTGLKDDERDWRGHDQRKRLVTAWNCNATPGVVDAGVYDAMVPIVPPALRPGHHLRNFHILFEAEWALRKKTQPAPKDPALLKQLGGDLYAVVAMWDLTELERAVLSGRMNAAG